MLSSTNTQLVLASQAAGVFQADAPGKKKIKADDSTLIPRFPAPSICRVSEAGPIVRLQPLALGGYCEIPSGLRGHGQSHTGRF